MSSQNIFDVFGRQKRQYGNSAVDNKLQINSGFKEYFDKIENKLKDFEKITEAISVSSNYISLNKKKRLVSVNPSINKNDVVVRSELDEVDKKLNKLIKSETEEWKKLPFEITKDCINIKDHKRICTTSKAINSFDVVVKFQLDEVSNKFDNFKKDEYNKFYEYTKDLFEKIGNQRTKREIDEINGRCNSNHLEIQALIGNIKELENSLELNKSENQALKDLVIKKFELIKQNMETLKNDVKKEFGEVESSFMDIDDRISGLN